MDPAAPEAPDQTRFAPVTRCWVCGGGQFTRAYRAGFDLANFAAQDPALAAYTGASLWMQRCRSCGFTQPEALPRLPGYFDRIYDQHWSAEWIEAEFASTYKDYIFDGVLESLGRWRGGQDRTLLDVGAHAGRFIHLASRAGWRAEGIELNPRTAAYARERTGLPVHRLNAHLLAEQGKLYSAVTLIDVLEHIPEPLQVMRQVVSLLEPGGWLAIKVPCASPQQMKERLRSRLRPRYDVSMSLSGNLVHLSYFSPRSLALALRNCGCREVRVSVAAPELPDFARTPPTLPRRASSLFRRAVYRAASWVPGGVHSPFAFNLQAYACKP